jgi:hypothetical protein
MPHWVSKLGDWSGGWLVSFTLTGVANVAWSKRHKLTAIFRKSKKDSPAIQRYSVSLVQLPTSDVRSASAGVGFSTPTSVSFATGISFSQNVTGFEIKQTK